jgi:hypothetical protein
LPLQIFLHEDQGRLAAAAICEPVAADSAHNPRDALLFGRTAAFFRGLRVSTQPVLVFQTPLMRHSPVVVRSADAAVERRLLDRLLDCIEEYAAALKVGIVFVGVTPEDEPLWDSPEFESTVRLEVEWSDFTRDHYRHKNGRDPLYGPQFLPQLSKVLGDDLLIFEAVRQWRARGDAGNRAFGSRRLGGVVRHRAA